MSIAPIENVTTVARTARSRLDHAIATSAAVVTARIHTQVERFREREDAGMTTAEYAIGILAAVAFAGVLLALLSSNRVEQALSKIVLDSLRPPR